MKIAGRPLLSRRHLVSRSVSVAAAAVTGTMLGSASLAVMADKSGGTANDPRKGRECDGEILGQGNFRYRAHRYWGVLDHNLYPVKDCHGIAQGNDGRIVLLTNETRNNLIAYRRDGRLIAAWEHRFRGAHGFDIVNHKGEDQYWITDHSRQLVSVCSPEGQELLHVGPEALSSKYPDITKYHPTNTATLPDGDFFIADGYGSSFIHHFDPKGSYISSFGGEGDAPENLKVPHAVWIDNRAGKPQLLVCDREHNMLKWFSTNGELLRAMSLGEMRLDDEPIGAFPCNVAQFSDFRHGRFQDHLAIACIGGMVLVLDAADRVVSVIGGPPAEYVDGKLPKLDVFNYTFNHPHDVCVDASGALYVAQWGSNRTYPIKLDLLSEAG